MKDIKVSAEYIKERVKMPEVIAKYHHLGRHRGRTSCPIHGGERDNLGFDDAVFHCFTCGASGDVIAFVQQLNGCDFGTAIKMLDADFGLGLTAMSDAERDAAARRASERRAAEERRSELIKANSKAFRAFRNYLWELRGRADAEVNPIVKTQLMWADRQIDLIMEDKDLKYPYGGVANSIERAREAVNAWQERTVGKSG